MTKKPTNTAIFLSNHNAPFTDLFFEGLEKLKLDGFAFMPLPTKEEIEKEIKAIEKRK